MKATSQGVLFHSRSRQIRPGRLAKTAPAKLVGKTLQVAFLVVSKSAAPAEELMWVKVEKASKTRCEGILLNQPIHPVPTGYGRKPATLNDHIRFRRASIIKAA